VTSLKIVPTSTARLQGYVEFETEEEMKKAINAEGIRLRDNEIYVTQFIPRDKREKLRESSWTNVFVKNLPGEISVNELNEMFEPYGTIISSVVTPIEVNGDVKSYGYVNFEKHDDAVKAVNELNETPYLGSTIYCTRAEIKSERKNKLKKSGDSMSQYYGRNLYVKNLGFDFTEEDLFREFSKYGAVTSVKIPQDEFGSKGFGYVCFETDEMAQFAIQDKAINRYVIGCEKPLIVSLHEPRNIREERFMRGDLSFVTPPSGQPWGYQTAPVSFPQPNFMLNDLIGLVSSLNQIQLQDKPSEQLRQTLGNILFPIIHHYKPMFATKITGMFLEWPVQQIYDVSVNPGILIEAIESASLLLTANQ